MIKYTRVFITFLLAVTVFAAHAQSTATSSSPYSRYGIGDIVSPAMPQNIGMGGIGVATNRISFFNNYNLSSINLLNPAANSTISLTTIDIGITTNFLKLSQTGASSQKNADFQLSHVAFGIPVSRRSALTFGLLPYSERGYNFKTSTKGQGTSGSAADTNVVNSIYSGEGGLSKAFIGYGFGIGRHLMLGGNVSYIFGNLQDNSAIEGPLVEGFHNTKIERSNAIGGLNYDYGVQYSIDLSLTRHVILGYSASAGTKLNSQSSYIGSEYFFDQSGVAGVPVDSIINNKGPKEKLKLPSINRFGISFLNEGKYMFGADYTMGNWSDVNIGGQPLDNLQNSKTFNIGGALIPDINSIHNYLSRVDYRIGFIYDQTYMNINNTSIKSYAGTFGLGLPLKSASGSFYKLNISAEVGQRGSLVNGLVKENYINIHVGFTLNDKWFQRYKFD